MFIKYFTIVETNTKVKRELVFCYDFKQPKRLSTVMNQKSNVKSERASKSASQRLVKSWRFESIQVR